MAAITGQRRTASLHSVGDVEARHLPADQWREFLFGHSRAMFALLHMVARRLEEATLKGTESILSSQCKIARALLELVNSGIADKIDDGFVIRRIGQEDLARMAGISRESVVQGLRHLKHESIVKTGRERLTVTDVDAVAAIASGASAAAC
jgi:CRP-like cAMP-binding protein